MIKKRITAVAGAFMLLGLGQAVLAPAASAAVPGCLAASVTHPSSTRTNVLVYNGCSTTQRFIVAWSLSSDSPCYTLKTGKHLTDTNLWSSFQGLKSC